MSSSRSNKFLLCDSFFKQESKFDIDLITKCTILFKGIAVENTKRRIKSLIPPTT